MRNTLRAFPEMWHAIDDIFSVDGKTAVHWGGIGTHQDGFAGLPASGKKLDYNGNTIFHFKDGLISEVWLSSNLVEQLRGFEELIGSQNSIF